MVYGGSMVYGGDVRWRCEVYSGTTVWCAPVNVR